MALMSAMAKPSKRDKQKRKSTRVIVGGHEDKEGPVIHEVARYVANGKLVIATVAAEDSQKYFEVYRQAFSKVGLPVPDELAINSREDALDPERLKVLDGVTGVFFTGGDQLRITSQLGDTPVEHRIREIYESGGMIAGTSAGAAAMCGSMIVRGLGNESRRPENARMAPGLGLIRGVILDQHFAQRGRMARLVGAVALNPRELGIGIDEDTAIVVEEGKSFFVMGSGAVYVIDATGVTRSNIAEDLEPDAALSIYDVRLHVLAKGDAFDLRAQRPLAAPKKVMDRLEKIAWVDEKEREKNRARGREKARSKSREKGGEKGRDEDTGKEAQHRAG